VKAYRYSSEWIQGEQFRGVLECFVLYFIRSGTSIKSHCHRQSTALIALPSSVSLIDSQSNPPPTLRSVSLQINVYHSSLFSIPSSLPKDNICSTTSLSHRNLMPKHQTSSPHFSPSPSFLSSSTPLISPSSPLINSYSVLFSPILSFLSILSPLNSVAPLHFRSGK
jgi:hypothetical protein